MNNAPIGIIYAGGTFGSYGTPLAPLNTDIFLPILDNFIAKNTVIGDHPIQILNNSIIKDSSTLTPDDFVQFYHTIQTAYQQGIKRILLITGTDTLAYLSAFLYYALDGIDIVVTITGSMYPLLHHDHLAINHHSDACSNLLNALTFLTNTNHYGVFVSFYNQILVGNSVHKINASAPDAFIGKPFKPSSPSICSGYFIHINRPIECHIHALYALPNLADDLALQLEKFNNLSPTAILLIGFGAGNLAQSDKFINTIKTLINKDFLVIMTSQSPFGERSNNYSAGAWQSTLGILSGGDLPIPALYGQALWLCVSTAPQNRKKQWKIY